jgi:hypothetical protein
VPIADYTPSLGDVGAVILARTKDQYGNVTGTFSTETVPNDNQVDAIINKATARVSMLIGTDIPEVCFDDANTLVCLRAAMFVETTYFPEQIVDNRSPYPVLKEQYESEMPELQLAITRAEDNAGSVLPDQPVLRTSYYFPASTTGSYRPGDAWYLNRKSCGG